MSPEAYYFHLRMIKIMEKWKKMDEIAARPLRLVASNGQIVGTPPPPPPRPEREVRNETASEETKRNDYVKLYMKAAEWGYKPGWADHKYKEKYGEWPPKDFRMR